MVVPRLARHYISLSLSQPQPQVIQINHPQLGNGNKQFNDETTNAPSVSQVATSCQTITGTVAGVQHKTLTLIQSEYIHWQQCLPLRYSNHKGDQSLPITAPACRGGRGGRYMYET